MTITTRPATWLVLFALVGAVALAGCSGGAGGSAEIKAENGALRINLAEVSDGKAHYYTAKAGDKTVRFFVLKSGDGIVRAAFDACDVCFNSKKGYTQQGEFMVCNNCGQRFHGSKINEVKGGCNPHPLARTVEGDKLVISVDSLNDGMRFF